MFRFTETIISVFSNNFKNDLDFDYAKAFKNSLVSHSHITVINRIINWKEKTLAIREAEAERSFQPSLRPV